MTDPREEFRQAMLDHFGFTPQSVVPTCTKQGNRFPTTSGKRNDLASKYIYSEDADHGYGWAIDYRSGISFTFRSDSYRKMPIEQRKVIDERIASAIAESRAEEEKLQQKAAEYANWRWNKSREITTSEDHPYLQAKGVKPFDLRVDWRGTLLIPIHDQDGKIVSLQMIFRYQDGFAKRFVTNGQVIGNTFTIGKPGYGEDIILAEGYATAASIHQATGKAVVVCFDCHKLMAAAKAMRGKHPASRIILAADDDRLRKDGNIGVEKARAAASAIDGYAVCPFWPDLTKANETKATDFNDMAALFGEDTVRLHFEKRCHPENRWFPYGSAAFELDDQKGVYYIVPGKKLEDPENRTWLCPPVHVKARVVDDTTREWFHLLTFQDHSQAVREEIIPDRLLCKRGTDLLETLVDRGLQVTQSSERLFLKDYIGLVCPGKIITKVNKDRMAWERLRHAGTDLLP